MIWKTPAGDKKKSIKYYQEEISYTSTFSKICLYINCEVFNFRATEFNPTNPCKKLKLDIPGFGDASPFMKAAKVEMERQIREVSVYLCSKF